MKHLLILILLLSLTVPARASLTFTSAGTDKVDCGSAAALDNVAAYTFWFWFRNGTTGVTRVFTGKATTAGNGFRFVVRSGDDLQFVQPRATVNANYISTNTLSNNTWYFLAGSYDGSASPQMHIYLGTLTSTVAEVSYGTTTDGTGTQADDSANTLQVGNYGGGSFSCGGRIATYGYVTSVLSLGQLKDLQFHPHVVANTNVFLNLGFNGTGSQPDWSGNGNAGTVTGATVSDHVPLGRLF